MRSRRSWSLGCDEENKMTGRGIKLSLQAVARTGGVLYAIIIIVAGARGELSIREKLIVPGDAWQSS
jgi:hypothetical protein